MNTPTPKIIQLLMSHNDSVWQGVLLGLGNDGMTYHCQGDTWQPYIPPLEPQDKATELTAVTEQRDRLQLIVDEGCRVSSLCREYREQRDKLAEALKMIATFDYDDLQCDNGHGARYVAHEALQSLNQPEP